MTTNRIETTVAQGAPRTEHRDAGISHTHSSIVSSFWREAAGACGAFEWLAISYLAVLNSLILLFGRNLAHPALYFLLHLGIGFGLLVLVRSAATRPNAALRFARHWYPLALFLFFFEELHYLAHLIFPVWVDRWLIQADYALLGAHATVWLESISSPTLNDAMQFAYMTYYFYTVVVCGLLLWKGRSSAFWRVMTATSLAYYPGYLISILFPIEGPYHTMAPLQSAELHGGFFTAVMDLVEKYGRVHGAAFPSAHVSGATVAVLGAWRYRRALFWTFLPFFVAMLVSTVYCRYHYASDVLGGLLVGAIAYHVVAQWPERYFIPAAAARFSNARNLPIS